MKKLAVAALVLGLAGIAVAGGIYVRNSLCNGCCPLTGEPIAAKTETTTTITSLDRLDSASPAASASFAATTAEKPACSSKMGGSGCPEAAAAAAAVAAAETKACQEKLSCEEQQDRECCKKKMECGDCETPPAKPAVEKP